MVDTIKGWITFLSIGMRFWSLAALWEMRLCIWWSLAHNLTVCCPHGFRYKLRLLSLARKSEASQQTSKQNKQFNPHLMGPYSRKFLTSRWSSSSRVQINRFRREGQIASRLTRIWISLSWRGLETRCCDTGLTYGEWGLRNLIAVTTRSARNIRICSTPSSLWRGSLPKSASQNLKCWAPKWRLPKTLLWSNKEV